MWHINITIFFKKWQCFYVTILSIWDVCSQFWIFVSTLLMMTSSNGNIFRVTGPLCGEFTGPGEFPTKRPVTRSFDVFFDLRLNKREAGDLRRHRGHYDVSVMYRGIVIVSPFTTSILYISVHTYCISRTLLLHITNPVVYKIIDTIMVPFKWVY